MKTLLDINLYKTIYKCFVREGFERVMFLLPVIASVVKNKYSLKC